MLTFLEEKVMNTLMEHILDLRNNSLSLFSK